ncbi:hypothetical protein [Motilimonas pumila]|uniref:Uncharacterized protein n=1 Tax=Motilimonas pumila TaxID=2303987 RepID=A0A418YCQ8_9GAMM|nr:hypothetical protein [Motilimonas pumila]RJG42271.1 hypothetical protein D1Z90_14310 [Motilimonas pumila]
MKLFNKTKPLTDSTMAPINDFEGFSNIHIIEVENDITLGRLFDLMNKKHGALPHVNGYQKGTAIFVMLNKKPISWAA